MILNHAARQIPRCARGSHGGGLVRRLLCSAIASGGPFILAWPYAAEAQSSPSAYTFATRYDAAGRIVGAIAPDPDGAGPLHYAAVRDTYDSAGRLTKVESGELATWQSETIAPSAWTGFTVFLTTETSYNAADQKGLVTTKGFDGIAATQTQFDHDARGSLQCSAVRMNPAQFATPPASACTLGAEGSFGKDRITKYIYDVRGDLSKVQKAFGTADQADYASYTYTPTGKQEYITDANGNVARFVYDGFDRLSQWQFPSKTTAGTVNAADFEQYGYDSNDNRVSLRKRDGSTLTYTYDALNRVSAKLVPERSGLDPSLTRDVYYSYDARGLMTKASFDGASGADAVTNVYDGFGELTSATLSMGTFSKTLRSSYDAGGRRTQLIHPENTGSYTFSYCYDGLDRLTTVSEGTVCATTPLDAFTYASNGLVTNRNEGSTGVSSSTYSTDNIGRVLTQADSFSAANGNLSRTFGYNPASQIVSDAKDNNAYAWTLPGNVSHPYAVNGLNQYTSVGSTSFAYDADGNLTSDGTNSYTYDVENRLVSGTTGTLATTLIYDPLGRLFEVVQKNGGLTVGDTRFVNDGNALSLEYDGSGNVINRYVHGTNSEADDPLVWYGGATLAGRHFLHSDHEGSIFAVTDATGAKYAINTYDEYGLPVFSGGQSVNTGRFQYTGQAWIAELNLYYYKARFYSPNLGRFLQADPIGYKDQINLYEYAGDDPIDATDPLGLCNAHPNRDTPPGDICRPASSLRLSDQGAKHIHTAEGGFHDKVYDDNGKAPGGNLTVGYGHKVTPPDDLKQGDVIDKGRGDSLFDKDTSAVEKSLRDTAGKTPLSQHEWDALVDLGFNAGAHVFSHKASPKLNDAIQRGDYDEMGNQLRYTGGPPATRQGLIKRSNERRDIFVGGDYPEN